MLPLLETLIYIITTPTEPQTNLGGETGTGMTTQ